MNTVIRRREPHDWWNTIALGVVGVVAILLIWLSVSLSASPGVVGINKAEAGAPGTQAATPQLASAVATTTESVPTSLADAGEYGENIYDYAKANDWKNADIKLAALKEAAKQVRADVRNDSSAVTQLDENVAALDRAVPAKDRQATMFEANQVTLDAANMTTAYKLSVPVEVTKLDYYGRQLEVWAQAKDANELQATAHEMRVTWDALRPSIEARSATEAKKFEALIAQVEGAKTPADNARVATLVLNEVDNLEKLFH
jgi:hypothetical protein